MSVKRIVDTGFWEDDKVMMMFSPEDKLFFLYLITNPHTTQLGVYRILPKQMAFELGYSSETINVLLERFQDKYRMVKYSHDTCEIAIKNYLRYSIVKGGKPVLDLLEKECKQVKDRRLLSFIKGSASLSDNDTVRAFAQTLIGTLNENDNENDNDNEDSIYESTYESVNESSKHVEIRHKYGMYDNVFLTDTDLAKLKQEFPSDWKDRIERLSEYIASSGKSYKSHLATIRSWARKNGQTGSVVAQKKLPAQSYTQRNYSQEEMAEHERAMAKRAWADAL